MIGDGLGKLTGYDEVQVLDAQPEYWLVLRAGWIYEAQNSTWHRC